VLLEFRTQEPQAALDSRLVITSADGERLEVGSSGAYSDPGVLTWSHCMRFRIPCSDLARVLASADVTITVAAAALKRATFRPATRDGIPVRQRVFQALSFRIEH
jgi:hypothetical protein